jgi:hypothetical protein
MTKIFLTNPPLNMAETPLQYHRPLVPMGLAYLGAKLEDEFSGGAWSDYVERRTAGRTATAYEPCGAVAAQDNMFLSFYGRYDYQCLRDRIATFAGHDSELFIGLSVLSDGMHAAKRMLRDLRRDFPHAVLLVGGPHATFFPGDFYSDPALRRGRLVDYVVKNEGELALLGIVNGKLSDLASAQRHASQYGINVGGCEFSADGYRIIDGGQYGTNVGATSRHVLDSLPAPALFLFEDETGNLPYEPDRRYGLSGVAANINSSRGCPHKCTFCTIPNLAPGYRTLSPQRIMEILRFMQTRYAVQSVFFREDNFMYSGGTLAGDRWPDIEALCNDLKALPRPLNWAIEARADNILQETSTGASRLELMKSAGLSGIYMGVEAASDAMLKLYVKGSAVHTMSAAMRACRATEVAVVATSCYGDPDLFLKRNHADIDPDNDRYLLQIIAQRDELLESTRSFMDRHEVPLEHREEYALVGIPVSAIYRVLEQRRDAYPALIEHYDPVTRYIFPKGFRWWAQKIYDLKRGVRSYLSYDYGLSPTVRARRPRHGPARP